MLTVVFATHNRAAGLPMVLRAFARLLPPAGGWRLVVVDNGSTDATPALLAAHCRSLPLRVLREARPGKNRALNAALPELVGDLAVFTDDDVLPAPDWLVRLRGAADRQPGRDVFGGTVVPHWTAPQPPWLSPRALPFSVLYAENRRATGACATTDVFGPNMAVRSALFRKGLRFAEAVGPDAGNPGYAMGSETELLRRLSAMGAQGWFVAEASVRHLVRPEQMTAPWVLQRAFRYGRGEGASHADGVLRGPLVFGLPAPLLLRLAVLQPLAATLRALPPGTAGMRLQWRERELAGIAAAFRDARRTTPLPEGEPQCT